MQLVPVIIMQWNFMQKFSFGKIWRKIQTGILELSWQRTVGPGADMVLSLPAANDTIPPPQNGNSISEDTKVIRPTELAGTLQVRLGQASNPLSKGP